MRAQGSYTYQLTSKLLLQIRVEKQKTKESWPVDMETTYWDGDAV